MTSPRKLQWATTSPTTCFYGLQGLRNSRERDFFFFLGGGLGGLCSMCKYSYFIVFSGTIEMTFSIHIREGNGDSLSNSEENY